MLPVFVGGMFYLPSGGWAVLTLPLVWAGAWEWASLCRFQAAGRWLYCAAVLFTAWVALLTTHHLHLAAIEQFAYAVSVAFWLLCAPVWLWRKWHLHGTPLPALVGWVLLVPTWLALVRLQELPWLLLAVLGVVWVADSAAYFAGHRWGRRKLAPSISPGKTWEGVLGAAVAVAVYHGVVWHFGFGNHAPEHAVAAALIVAMIFPLSILGDLFESWSKREAGVKDSGTLLPGHGGVLDRIDALTSTLPFAALMLSGLL